MRGSVGQPYFAMDHRELGGQAGGLTDPLEDGDHPVQRLLDSGGVDLGGDADGAHVEAPTHRRGGKLGEEYITQAVGDVGNVGPFGERPCNQINHVRHVHFHWNPARRMRLTLVMTLPTDVGVLAMISMVTPSGAYSFQCRPCSTRHPCRLASATTASASFLASVVTHAP